MPSRSGQRGSMFTSDLIQSRGKKMPVQSQNTASAGSRKKGASPSPPKSKEVSRLEGLVDSLNKENGSRKDPKGGCFCLGRSPCLDMSRDNEHRLRLPFPVPLSVEARGHPISPYTPVCLRCGLILCDVNLPQFACPHCVSPLLSPPERDILIKRLDDQITSTLVKEAADRERIIAEARQAAGAFPTLSSTVQPSFSASSSSSSLHLLPPDPPVHKVLSLNSKTKRPVLSTYTRKTPSPATSNAPSRGEVEDEPDRLPPPPKEAGFIKAHPDPSRPWADVHLATTALRYIPLKQSRPDNSGGKPRKRGGKSNPSNQNAGSSSAGNTAI